METILIEILGFFREQPLAWLGPVAAIAAAGLAAAGLRRRRLRASESVAPPPATQPPRPEPLQERTPPLPIEVPAAPRPAERQDLPEPPLVAPSEPVAAPPPAPTLRDSIAAPAPVPAPHEIPAPIEPVIAPAPAPPAAPPRVRLRARLRRTSAVLAGRLGGLLGGGRSLDPSLLDELEEILMTADLGVATAESLLERVRREAQGTTGDEVRALLRRAIAEKLEGVQRDADPLALASKPHVILVLGVNGAGKTTTIGKLAAQHLARGHSVLLGAGDTFRAAAIEQLQVWGERVGCDVVAGEAGGDPASVAFDTVKAAVGRGVDVAIIDTAGRLQTKKPLMEELGKIARVIGRDVPGAPHETLLVLDANTGQNAISQARLFTEVAKVTGLVLTKLDGTAKGGVVVGLADQFGIPVKFVGVGESVEDLRPFEADEFVDALFGEGDGDGD